MEMKKSTRYKMRDTRYENGSALILAVVLTSLLAVLGMMFVMIARVDRIATSAISENKDLNSAVEAVIAKISQELVLDVPGLSKGREYYDYPDANNAWLASLEPYDSGGYKWRQISDVYNKLGTDLELDAVIIPDYQDSSEVGDGEQADAEGDGVADSKWVELDDITSNKGKPIFAAVRVIDNGAMINVNTAYKFDPTESRERIDGSSQMQINLAALSQRGSNGSLDNAADDLQDERCGSEPNDLSQYEENVVWRYYPPAEDTAYTPFDISDELELRNRFLLEFEHIDTRIEKEVWTSAFTGIYYLHVPVGQNPKIKLADWFARAQYDVSDPNAYDTYSYRHIATTYNMDRIIRPNGDKMLNINDPCVGVESVYDTIKTALSSADPNFGDVNDIAAQIAVNLIDFRDADSDVATLDVDDETYYGFEVQPFISEIGIKIGVVDPDNESYYAVELYNPFNVAIPLEEFELSISDQADTTRANISLSSGIGPKNYFVISNDLSQFGGIPAEANSAPDAPALKLSGKYVDTDDDPTTFENWDNYNITLKRRVNGNDLIVDKQATQKDWFQWTALGTEKYVQRDRDNWQFVYENERDDDATNTLGSINAYNGASGTNYNLAIPNSDFITIGDISKVLRVGPSTDPCDTIGEQLVSATSEADVRIDLADDSDYHNLFQYLTVMDPSLDLDSGGQPLDNDGDGIANETELNQTPEFKVPGRININTAPWFVIAQLPWMTETIAQAIVNDRDTQDGFESIGELMNVDEMGYYKTVEGGDLTGFPDLTPGGSTGDDAIDDFEERDVIFARISNLVTVRSDVFTAYILVRIGADGPQKRVIAILDRSDVYSPNGKVRIVALHPVADPR
jgi:hypothetical protein